MWRYQAAAEASGSPKVIVCAMETDIGEMCWLLLDSQQVQIFPCDPASWVAPTSIREQQRHPAAPM